MSLTEYRHKRDFQKTPEPRGKRAPKSGGGKLTFVIRGSTTPRIFITTSAWN